MESLIAIVSQHIFLYKPLWIAIQAVQWIFFLKKKNEDIYSHLKIRSFQWPNNKSKTKQNRNVLGQTNVRWMKAEVRKLYQDIIKNGESSGKGLASRDMLHKLLIYSIHTFGSGSECNFLPFVDTKGMGKVQWTKIKS